MNRSTDQNINTYMQC